jgi:uncharacterized protein (TIGR02145 family)
MLKIYHSHFIKTMVRPLFFESNLKKIMKKQITYLFIFLISLTTLQGQVEQQSLPSTMEIINRRSPFNLEELKVRWKKAALENCPGVPCITATVPGPPTSVTASAGNASASVVFVAPTNNGGSAITGYTVTSSPGGITATGTTSPINVTGLTNGTAYTFTIVATNAVGNSSPSTASSAVTPLPPVCPTSTVTDVDGNIYNTVAIGTQCWTKENLKVTTYNDGTNIPLDASGGTTGDGAGETWTSQTTGARTVYGHDNTNLSIYGYLYNWYAVSDSRKICPIGWHVPTDTEWETMGDLLGGRATIAGKLKQTGTTLWTTQGPGTDNSSGFTALPGGQRTEYSNGNFASIRNSAYFWTANPATSSSSFASGPSAFDRNPDHNNARLYRTNRGAAAGFSVRCIKD